eukprot:Nitzschia sp. Nitz4//scaffold111_size72815//30948//31813//NITZ4_005788-RA/size72815-processed-gene-0.51-mRNA-1//1//CDS//3329533174//9399//frame0
MSSTTTTTSILHVAVGSTNPVKVAAVKNALQQAILTGGAATNAESIDIQVHGYSVPSGVPDQPIGDGETLQGAKNRARAAYEAYQQAFEGSSPHVAFGLEGGLEWITEDIGHQDDDHDSDKKGHKSLWCMAWMAAYGPRHIPLLEYLLSEGGVSVPTDSTTGAEEEATSNPLVFGCSKTATFALPDALRVLIIDKGMELGHADDIVFERSNSKQKSGTVGLLTGGRMGRAQYYEHALLLAMVRWIRSDVY